jgi:hypothetical protein
MANTPPSGTVTITGAAAEDQVLTAISTLADIDGLGTLHYFWQRNVGGGFVNVGADQSTYTLGDGDIGGTVRVVVYYTDAGGTLESVPSAATAVIVDGNHPHTGGASVTGTAAEDHDGGSGFVNVGLDQATYTLGDSDVDAVVRVLVAYIDQGGSAEVVPSAATAAIAVSTIRIPAGCQSRASPSRTGC